ncbi:Uncharacterised protein [Clostridium putrefaciens]|uniref:Coenzyme PQQ synthesis protein D (PqqD) n=1 Tax=Clostridium putrefaciens TaxID=99675 RepID=A0A381J5L7_9CLOT|nr:hypothetical protein [Clostridium putrefaciens]SUY45329.1 Uncharacterised protein [Clostridium putrefaciens]
MVKIVSTDFPIRVVEKTDFFYLFNTKTFETISLDKISIRIFEKIKYKGVCTNDELNQYAKINNVSEKDVWALIDFLQINQFLSVSKGLNYD